MRKSAFATLTAWLVAGLFLVALGLRLWRIDTAPPGWSDDELSNTFVLSQKVLDGRWAFYFPDASGHEALYHTVVAGTIRLLGHNFFGIRLVSMLLGSLSVPLLYQLGRRLFDRRVGLLAAAGLAVSFWSLIYSRIGLRHISMPFFMLLSFGFLWQALGPAFRALSDQDDPAERQGNPAPPPEARPTFRGLGRPGGGFLSPYLWSGVFMGLGFYTYFAARGVPLIVLAFALYLFLARRRLRLRHGDRVWRGLLLLLVVAGLLAIPLILSLRAQEGADARVAELAVPVVAARAGDWTPLGQHVLQTLNMFHATGDNEFLYNIPGRPVFGLLLASLFWVGVSLALWRGLALLIGPARWSPALPEARRQAAAGLFLLVWWLAGLSPGFLSVPPASLGHTIVALPATYLLLALPLTLLDRFPGRDRLALGLGLVVLALVAARDLPDYLTRWPARGNTRFLYHADLADAAAYLQRAPDLTDVALSSLLLGPWDRLALELELEERGLAGQVRPRLFQPERAIFLALADRPATSFYGYPRVGQRYEAYYGPLAGKAGGFSVAQVRPEFMAPGGALDQPACFANGLCLLGALYDATSNRLELTWRVAGALALPPMPVISKPPPPGVYDGPRLSVFTHWLDPAGGFLGADDGLWVDPGTLQPGDVFRQEHRLPPGGEGPARILVGLYDPLTGDRILTAAGQDHLVVFDD